MCKLVCLKHKHCFINKLILTDNQKELIIFTTNDIITNLLNSNFLIFIFFNKQSHEKESNFFGSINFFGNSTVCTARRHAEENRSDSRKPQQRTTQNV